MGVARDHGAAGEALAAAYLELIGCAVVARNVKLAGVEVDLVADDGGTQVLVEVKTRTRSDYGGAALALGAAQRVRLLRAAATLDRSRRSRIDLVSIETTADGAGIRHYRSAVSDA
jgi:putative endonuclease